MRRVHWLLILSWGFVACSSPNSNTTDAGLPPLPVLPQVKDPTTTQEAATTQSTAASTQAAEVHVLSDLMHKVRDNAKPLMVMTDEAAAKEADKNLEALFLKIRASAPSTAPDDWRKSWVEITEGAISGIPDERGLRPWPAACKKCHDAYQKTYKKKYHTRTIPIDLD